MIFPGNSISLHKYINGKLNISHNTRVLNDIDLGFVMDDPSKRNLFAVFFLDAFMKADGFFFEFPFKANELIATVKRNYRMCEESHW